MAWLSRNNFSTSDQVHADDLNNLANDTRTWGSDVNGGGHHLSNVIIDAYYPGPGTGTGSPLHIIPPGATDYSAQLRLDSEVSGNQARWIIMKDAAPESSQGGTGGANSGSNFALERCDDSGNVLSTPIAIDRKSGLMTLGQTKWGGNVDGGGFSLTNVVIPSVFADPTTTKGDLVARGAAAPASRLPVGSDGTVLIADSTQALGMKWATSPAVPTSTQVIAGAGLSGGGALTGNVTLTANVQTVFGRTGAVMLTAADITGATGVINTRQVLAGAGMSGGGPLTADVTLNALVTSVFGRTGAVTLTAADVTAGGGVAATRQVIAGSGMSGGGALSADVTLNALVTSVFGRTGAVVLTAADISTGGGIPATRQVLTAAGSGLAGGGALSADLNLSVVPNTTVQKLNFSSGAGSIISTRNQLNFIQGSNVTLTVADNSSGWTDVTINSAGVTAIWVNNSLVGNRPTINLIPGSNVTITGADNSSSNRVDVTFSAVGGTGGAGSQTPWTSAIDAAGNTLANVNSIGVNRTFDPTARIAIQCSDTECGVRTVNSSTTGAAQHEIDNDNATAKIYVKAYGSAFATSTLKSTAGLNMLAGVPMVFCINDSEAMRVSAGGRLLLGSTVDDGANKLQITGNFKINTSGNGLIFPDGTKQTTASVGGMTDPTTTLGDLIVRGSTVTMRLGVGANNQMLIADSTAPVGVKWGVPTAAMITPAGSDQQIQINKAGALGADAGLTFDYTNKVLRLNATATPGSVVVTSDYSAAYSQFVGYAYSAAAYNNGATFRGYSARGSAAAPTLSKASDTTAGFQGFGYTGSAWQAAGALYICAESDWSPTNTAGYFAFYTGYGSGSFTERMRITSAGNVGIGTANPRAKLALNDGTVVMDIGAAYSSRPAVGTSIINGEIHAGLGPGADGGFIRISAGGEAGNYRAYIDLSGYSPATDLDRTIVLGTGNTERMRITSGGNVGIGLTNPQQKLEVNGAATSIAATGSWIDSNVMATTGCFYFFRNSDTSISIRMRGSDGYWRQATFTLA